MPATSTEENKRRRVAKEAEKQRLAKSFREWHAGRNRNEFKRYSRRAADPALHHAHNVAVALGYKDVDRRSDVERYAYDMALWRYENLSVRDECPAAASDGGKAKKKKRGKSSRKGLRIDLSALFA